MYKWAKFVESELKYIPIVERSPPMKQIRLIPKRSASIDANIEQKNIRPTHSEPTPARN